MADFVRGVVRKSRERYESLTPTAQRIFIGYVALHAAVGAFLVYAVIVYTPTGILERQCRRRSLNPARNSIRHHFQSSQRSQRTSSRWNTAESFSLVSSSYVQTHALQSLATLEIATLKLTTSLAILSSSFPPRRTQRNLAPSIIYDHAAHVVSAAHWLRNLHHPLRIRLWSVSIFVRAT